HAFPLLRLSLAIRYIIVSHFNPFSPPGQPFSKILYRRGCPWQAATCRPVAPRRVVTYHDISRHIPPSPSPSRARLPHAPLVRVPCTRRMGARHRRRRRGRRGREGRVILPDGSPPAGK